MEAELRKLVLANAEKIKNDSFRSDRERIHDAADRTCPDYL